MIDLTIYGIGPNDKRPFYPHERREFVLKYLSVHYKPAIYSTQEGAVFRSPDEIANEIQNRTGVFCSPFQAGRGLSELSLYGRKSKRLPGGKVIKGYYLLLK